MERKARKERRRSGGDDFGVATNWKSHQSFENSFGGIYEGEEAGQKNRMATRDCARHSVVLSVFSDCVAHFLLSSDVAR